MKKLLVMDAHNYPPNMEEIYRVAVRGIIFIDGKLLMIENSFGETFISEGAYDLASVQSVVFLPGPRGTERVRIHGE